MGWNRRRKFVPQAWLVVIIVLSLVLTEASIASAHETPKSTITQTTASYALAVSTGVSDPLTNIGIVGEAAPDRQQVEPTIAVDPRDPNILVAGAQDLRLRAAGEHRWHGYYRSNDGGNTWTSNLLPGFPGDNSPQGLASPLHASNTTSDPVLAFDRVGNLYYAGLVFNVSATGSVVSNTVVFVAKYIGDGQYYSGTTLIAGPLFSDKEWIAADNSGGPHDGNVYLAFDANLTAGNNFATLFTRSTDGGKTFSTPFYAPSDQTGELPGVAVDNSGNVYVSTDAFDPVTGNPITPNYIQVTKLTNGGTTIVQNVKAVNPAVYLQSSPPGASFRAYTIPQVAADTHGVYVVFDDVGLGNSNVFFTRSTDGGSTWTSPLRLNDVISGQHFFPTVAAAGGIVNVAWYDSRLNTGTTMTALDVFYTNSLNDGDSFNPNVRITNVSFNPNIVPRTDYPGAFNPFMGDYIGIAASAFAAHPIWADNRFACDTFDPTFGCVDQDTFTATINLPDFSVSANPGSLNIIQDQSAASNVTIASLNGFSGSVLLQSASNPSGLPLGPSSKIVTLTAGGTSSFNLTFSPTQSTIPQGYTVNVSGLTSSPTRSHLVQISVTVSPKGSIGGAIIPVDKLAVLALLVAPVLALLVGVFSAAIVWNATKKRQPRTCLGTRGEPP